MGVCVCIVSMYRLFKNSLPMNMTNSGSQNIKSSPNGNQPEGGRGGWLSFHFREMFQICIDYIGKL